MWIGVATIPGSTSWLITEGENNSSAFDIYVVATYWVIVTVNTAGYGDITG